MLRVAASRVAPRAMAVRAMASKAPALANEDFEAIAGVVDTEEGRRMLANIRTYFVESEVSAESTETGPKIDWAELKKDVDPEFVAAHDEAIKGLKWPVYDDSASQDKLKADFAAFQKEAEALTTEAKTAIADVEKDIAKTERIMEKVESMTVDEYLEEFPEDAKRIDEESLQNALMA